MVRLLDDEKLQAEEDTLAHRFGAKSNFRRKQKWLIVVSQGLFRNSNVEIDWTRIELKELILLVSNSCRDKQDIRTGIV